MAATPVVPYPAASTVVRAAGVSEVAVYADVQGGKITNPGTAASQGIAEVEVLFYSLLGPATLTQGAGTFALQPGASFDIPPGTTVPIYVNAATAGHQFSAYILQPVTPYPPTPFPTPFPPTGPTSLQETIRSYLYEQYKDDSNLQASRRAYNELAQAYVTWFNQFSLSVYTNDAIAGALLDWVALGVYGMRRPVLASGQSPDIGPINTWAPNELDINGFEAAGPANVTVTNDDIFKRIMTWRLYRGDGRTFNMVWLKRRIKRFLYGENGRDVRIENTYDISANYAANRQINIILPSVANADVLKEAFDSGALDLPFQYTFSVTIAS